MRLKKILFTCVVVMSLCVANSALAQKDTEEAEHEVLRELKVVFEEAVNKNRMELIEPYLDKDFSVVTFTDREFTDFEKFKTRWKKTRAEMLKGWSYSIKLLPVRSHIIDDIAIARGDSENIMVTGDGEKFKFTAHWTAVCRKTDGKWKILRGHYSLDPFGNPMLKQDIKKTVIKVGIITAAVGILMGLIVGGLVGRRK